MIYQITIKHNTMNTTKKITMATLKSFVKKNSNDLHINLQSAFSGYTDCVESVGNTFQKTSVKTSDVNYKHTLGVDGAWFVGSSRDYLNAFENDSFIGIEVYNSCGCFILAVSKN